MTAKNLMAKCDHCFLIFKQGEKTCRRCQRPTVVLGAINSPTICDPEYTDWYYDEDFRRDAEKTLATTNHDQPTNHQPASAEANIIETLKRYQKEDPLRAEDPYLLNHHPFRHDGPGPRLKKTGL